MTNEEAKVFLDNLKVCIEEHPIVADWLVEIADRKTEPTISKMEQVDEPQKCDDCIWNVCNYNKAFEDEPQTDYGDFAGRLAYERGVKHAWEVAQKVFDSTVTFYEAEDVAKQISKTEQTDYKKWEAPPKVDLPTGEITTCVTVLARQFLGYACETCKHRDEDWNSEACDGCCENHDHYEPQDEPQAEGPQSAICGKPCKECGACEKECGMWEILKNEPQTDCSWK